MSQIVTPLIWLLVIFLGITVGAGLYESRIIIPAWAHSAPPTWVNTGTRFWAFVSTGPLTLIILAGFAVVWSFQGLPRPWWLAALCVAALERIGTFAYFIPTMIRLQQQPALTPEVASALSTWSLANHGRHILTFAAWMLALKALSLLNASPAAHDQ